MALSATRLDDASVGAFARSLEHIEAKILEKKYPQLKFAEGLVVPIEYTPGIEWAETVTYRMISGVGQFELARDYTNTVPMVDILSEEFTQKVFKYIGGYYYSEEEAYKAVKLNMPLEDQKVSLVRRVAMQTMNRLIAFGDKASGQHGFINHPAWLRSYAAFKLNSSSTSAECLAVLNGAVTSVITITKGMEEPNTLLMPYEQFEYLTTTRLDNAVDGKTIMKQYMENQPHIKDVQPLNELKGAGPNGEDVMIVYKRDPECVKARITDAFRFRNLEQKPFGYERPAAFKIGGIVPYIPYSVHVLVGI